MKKRLPAVLAVSVLALAGCAGDDEGEPSEDTPTSAVPESEDGGGERGGTKEPDVGPQLDGEHEDTEKGDNGAY